METLFKQQLDLNFKCEYLDDNQYAIYFHTINSPTLKTLSSCKLCLKSQLKAQKGRIFQLDIHHCTIFVHNLNQFCL